MVELYRTLSLRQGGRNTEALQFPAAADPSDSLDAPSPSLVLLPRQLLAADFLEQRQVVLHELPHHRRRDALVIVAQHVADAGHLGPRNFRMAGLEFVAQPPAGFRNDLDAALDEPALAPVGLEGVKRHARRLAADVFDRLDDVGKARGERGRGH